MRYINLFSGYNQEEDFRILICAIDKEEAGRLAEEYRLDSKLSGRFEIEETEKEVHNMHFDCDHVITYGGLQYE